MSDGLHDPFATEALRGRVLDAWAASPARFREDANAEEDYALGGYRDRVVVELAQNAADAAVRGGVPGRLRLTMRHGMLVAANTGAPLDAAGVEALSTLRASSKRRSATADGMVDGATDGTVGRFGVGFAAAVAVSDEPRIRSTTGAVGWSRALTQELAGAIPALTGSLRPARATSRCSACRSRWPTRRRAARPMGSRPRWSCRCATATRLIWSCGCWPRLVLRSCSRYLPSPRSWSRLTGRSGY